MTCFFSRRIANFKSWWHRPPTRKDRVLGAVVGAIGGFWLGLIAFGVCIDGPAPLLDMLRWMASGAGIGLVCGIVFPKVTTCALFPFSLLGIGDS